MKTVARTFEKRAKEPRRVAKETETIISIFYFFVALKK